MRPKPNLYGFAAAKKNNFFPIRNLKHVLAIKRTNKSKLNYAFLINTN